MTSCSGSAGTLPWTVSLNVMGCPPAPWARSRVFPANDLVTRFTLVRWETGGAQLLEAYFGGPRRQRR